MQSQDNHPGMTDAWFADAVTRAVKAGLAVTPHETTGRFAYVSSSRNPEVRHLVSRYTCDCEGHRSHGRCMHRAYAIWANDEFNALATARTGAFRPRAA